MGGKPGDPRNTQRWKRLRAEVYRTESVCWLCGRAVDFDAKPWQPLAPNCDHVIPVELRPDLALDRTNVRLACRSCNSWNRARMPDPANPSVSGGNGAAVARPPYPHQHNHSRVWTEEHTLRDCPTCTASCTICGPRR